MATIEELAGCISRRCTVHIVDERNSVPGGYKVIHRNIMGERIKFFYQRDLMKLEMPIGNLILAWIVHEVHNEELPIRHS